ncbi:MAG: DUF1289 domain-containing protein [Betaproteobacteria bacterium]|nr:DUF1289 domain-containing protein [Betaproteobacteria bacterium]
MSTPAPRAVASPCVSLCRMDADSGWCLGCLRTLDEIANWGSLDDAGKREVMIRLGPRRLAARARKLVAQVRPEA